MNRIIPSYLLVTHFNIFLRILQVLGEQQIWTGHGDPHPDREWSPRASHGYPDISDYGLNHF